MSKELPEDYYCPKCNAKANRDLAHKLRKDGMPLPTTINMALHILEDAECPESIMRQIVKWSEKYRTAEYFVGMNEGEADKLKLLKWVISCGEKK